MLEISCDPLSAYYFFKFLNPQRAVKLRAAQPVHKENTSTGANNTHY